MDFLFGKEMWGSFLGKPKQIFTKESVDNLMRGLNKESQETLENIIENISNDNSNIKLINWNEFNDLFSPKK